ncbi:MAG TPA: zf-HC2 domain-containing protein [Anaerolineae bacterium]|nr:zf-HC2 domain-containing protein [Anaerolineae bacterium]
MQCREASEMMSLRLDSELHPQEEQALLQHVLTCDNCQAEWEAIQRACALFRSPTFAPPPPDLSSKVMTRVRRHQSHLATLRNGVALLLAVVILASLCLSFWLVASPPVESVLDNPPLVSAMATIVVGIVTTLVTLLRAVALVVQAVVAAPGCIGLLGYVAVAGALTMWWVRLVSGRRVLAPRREIL